MEINRPSVLSLMDDEIRDDVEHLSGVSHERGFARSTYYFVNGLDKDVSVQPEASTDESFTDIFDIGAPFAVAVGVKTYQTLTDRHPFIRFSVSTAPAVIPTSGSFKITAAKNGI